MIDLSRLPVVCGNAASELIRSSVLLQEGGFVEAGMKPNLSMIIVWVLMGFAVYSEGDRGGMAPSPQVSPRCSPVLLLDCIGSQKDHPSDKCCTSLRSIAKEKCFCSRLRAGVVDAATYIPIAQACGISPDLGNSCQRGRSDGQI